MKVGGVGIMKKGMEGLARICRVGAVCVFIKHYLDSLNILYFYKVISYKKKAHKGLCTNTLSLCVTVIPGELDYIASRSKTPPVGPKDATDSLTRFRPAAGHLVSLFSGSCLRT